MLNRIRKYQGCVLAPFLLMHPALMAQDLVPTQLMGLDLARDIAQGTIDACRKDDYRVAVVVTDRSGDPVVMMRDLFVSKYMMQLAQNKANAVVMSNTSSGEMRVNMERIRDELNELDGVLVIEGGLPIRVAGSLIGAVGVSGAPGGDKDEACARHGLEMVYERLNLME